MTPLLLIPAIDLKDNQVVRLARGAMASAKVYSDDPVAMAQHWVDCGAQRLHIVDLNGAVAGQPIHFNIITQITQNISGVVIEVGGGIRDLQTIARYLDAGAHFVILGTVAVKNPELARQACQHFPGRIILGLDTMDGKVATEGWGQKSELTCEEMAQRLADAGAAAIIHTDISRDGLLVGLNLEATRQLARVTPLDVIASGGLKDLQDIRNLRQVTEPNLIGAITGKAIYEGTLDFKTATQVLMESFNNRQKN